MSLPDHIADLNELERQLGDPFDESRPFSFKQAMRHDESETLPGDAMILLRDLGVIDYLVPQALGGKLHSYQHLYYVIRLLSRRDVTLATLFVLKAIGLGPVLIAGTNQQKQYYSREILNGCGISWGITEREHGSDLINSSATAQWDGERYCLNGAKWLIGMARHNEMAMFLAKAPGCNTPDAFTMFCVDNRRHTDREYQRLPKEKLHGVRGLDLSGFRLDNCRVEADCAIDKPGNGLELLLRTAQLHRVGAVTMALGALDTGLRIALSFANSRYIFGQRLADIPITRLELTDTFCDLLLSELVVTAATRALHYAPKAMFLQAAVSKYLVATFTRQGFSRLAGAIGARYYLRETFAFGMFQKAMRDAEMTSFVDGNEKVNLKNIALHMEVTLPYLQKSCGPSDEELARFAEFFDLNRREPDARFSELAVFSGRKDLVLMMLNDSLEKLEARLDQRGLDAATRSSILEQARKVPADIDNLREQMQAQKAKLQKTTTTAPRVTVWQKNTLYCTQLPSAFTWRPTPTCSRSWWIWTGCTSACCGCSAI